MTPDADRKHLRDTADDVDSSGFDINSGYGRINALRAVTERPWWIIEPLITNSAQQFSPSVYENNIVWNDNRDGNREIYLIDISTKQETRITNNPSDQLSPFIHGKNIVYSDNRNNNYDVFVYNSGNDNIFGTTDDITEKQITTNTSDQIVECIQGNRLVFRDTRNGNKDIYIYDLGNDGIFGTNDDISERQITTNTSDQFSPEIYKNIVAWEDYRNSALDPDIYIYDLSTGQERWIAKGFVPAIYEDKIVYYNNRNNNMDVFMFDLSTGQETRITNNPYSQNRPRIYGNMIVWQDTRNSGTLSNDIYCFDLSTNQETMLAGGSVSQGGPFIYKDIIAWIESPSISNPDIYMARRPQIYSPLNSDNEPVCIPATNNYTLSALALGFLVAGTELLRKRKKIA